jgi:hypothetical protein
MAAGINRSCIVPIVMPHTSPQVHSQVSRRSGIHQERINTLNLSINQPLVSKKWQ